MVEGAASLTELAAVGHRQVHIGPICELERVVVGHRAALRHVPDLDAAGRHPPDSRKDVLEVEPLCTCIAWGRLEGANPKAGRGRAYVDGKVGGDVHPIEHIIHHAGSLTGPGGVWPPHSWKTWYS